MAGFRGTETAQAALDRKIIEFANSEVFDRLFREGMGLVEQTATYLDGPGRQESRALPREAALAYAAESMELTTRLMQAASWLVVQRAVRDGDMSPAEAREEKYRLGAPLATYAPDISPDLPQALRDLAEASRRLFERVTRLDEAVYAGGESSGSSPVHDQLARLRQAADDGQFDPLGIWRRG
jgi:regulator of CtrA degradation